jgi:hypothetical protein
MLNDINQSRKQKLAKRILKSQLIGKSAVYHAKDEQQAELEELGAHLVKRSFLRSTSLNTAVTRSSGGEERDSLMETDRSNAVMDVEEDGMVSLPMGLRGGNGQIPEPSTTSLERVMTPEEDETQRALIKSILCYDERSPVLHMEFCGYFRPVYCVHRNRRGFTCLYEYKGTGKKKVPFLYASFWRDPCVLVGCCQVH